MYVVAQHKITNPAKFWSTVLEAAPNLPAGLRMVMVLPSVDGTSGTCLWEASSVNTVSTIVEASVGHLSTTEYYAVDSERALGL